jgi:peptide deformylase
MTKKNKESIAEWIVQVGRDYKANHDIFVTVDVDERESEVLHRRLFNVNMRLFQNNPDYRDVIKKVIAHMKAVITSQFYDYPVLKGLSAANVGIPFNIIAVVEKDDLPKDAGVMEINKYTRFCINPVIVRKSRKKRTVKSNCGSMNLTKPVEVERHEWIKLEYYDIEGRKHIERFEGRVGSTIQHEVEHNLGVLITDKEVKP